MKKHQMDRDAAETAMAEETEFIETEAALFLVGGSHATHILKCKYLLVLY